MPTDFTVPTVVHFDARYPGMSPQLLARTRQTWSAGGLDLDDVWRRTIGRFRGAQTIGNWGITTDSALIDQFFMFEQATIWVATLNATASLAVDRQDTRLTNPQWCAIHGMTFRMIEQLDAIRLLFLTGLQTPSLQIARSISEDIDMALAFVSRPKLAARFIECVTIEDANEFWRRHVAGGRAFKAVSEQLYRAGLEFDQSGEYAAWRKDVKAILGTAVHSAYRAPNSAAGRTDTSDCLYFVTLRLQEMCAYSHGLTKQFGEDLEAIQRAKPSGTRNDLGCLTARISKITVEQLRWTLTKGEIQDSATPHRVH